MFDEEGLSPWDRFKNIYDESQHLYNRDPQKYSIHQHVPLLTAIYGTTYWEAYYFHRAIDDILDTDRDISEHPFTYVADIREKIATGNLSNTIPIEALGRGYISFLEKNNPFPEYNPTTECLRSVDGMLFDYSRSRSRMVLSQEQLNYYYQETFESVLRLSEMLLGIRFPPQIMDLLIWGQGNIYTLRDLKWDWESGIINIPDEVLGLAKLSSADSISDIFTNKVVRDWASTITLQFNKYVESSQINSLVNTMLVRQRSLKGWLLVRNLIGTLQKTAKQFL